MMFRRGSMGESWVCSPLARGIEIGSAPMLWMCSSSGVTCLLLLRISVVSIQLCSTSQSWDILFNVLLCPDYSLVGVGGQFLLSLCYPVSRALPWKGHEMWPWQLWQRLLEAFWHFLFLNQKIPLSFNITPQIFGKKKSLMLFQKALLFLLPSFKEY